MTEDKAQRYNQLIDQGITDLDILARAVGKANMPRTPGHDLLSRDTGPSSPTQRHPPTPATPGAPTPAAADVAEASRGGDGGGFFPEDDDDDFRSAERHFRTPIVGQNIPVELADSLEDTSLLDHQPWEPRPEAPRRMSVPKIFFGTRTHKQIYQIIKELRRTSYSKVRSVVLGSRKYTCIHPIVSKSSNQNEGCRDLLDPHTDRRRSRLEEVEDELEIRVGSGCRFHHGVNQIKNHTSLAAFGMDTAWDIEDLVTLGKKIKACPYYVARSLMATAEIIFCPYNYLIDPLIRESMDISLCGQVVVLDEAHNIEDSAREAASCTLTQDEILTAKNELDKMVELELNVQECTNLSCMLNALSEWVNKNSDKLTDYVDFDRAGKIFKGTEMIANLELLGIGYDKYMELKGYLSKLTADPDPEDENPRINSSTSTLLKNLFLMYHFLFMDNMKYRDDYRIAIVRAQTRKKGAMTAGGWYSSKKSTVGWAYSINFWCLNPAVAFLSVGFETRSIILTSGTLSPMNSFQSELGVPFKIQLEANHVIDRNQVWVGTIGRGPTNKMLQATFRNTENYEFQDELGRLVLDVCKAVPQGILCFLPSYAMLNKLLDRWQNTGMWDELNQIKVAITEPRNSEKFEEAMALFYDTIKNSGTQESGEINGAFFMAVCRGKVSEGLDFTDDNARAVIAVGIPFPSIKDIQVDAKRQYNNEHCRTRGLLSGGDWYEIQAYRAINQALGRCIRHRYDWGALILVDERYQQGSLASGLQQNRYTRGLSKWVRNKIVHHQNFSFALSDLHKFAEGMIKQPPRQPESLDETMTQLKEVEITEPQATSCTSVNCCTPKKHDIHDKYLKQSPNTSKFSLHHADSHLTNQTSASFSPGSRLAEVFNSTVCSDQEICRVNYLIDDEDIIIPSGRLPLTSTQLSKSGDADADETPGTNNISRHGNSASSCFVSALTLSKQNYGINNTSIQKMVETKSENINPPSKRKKSYVLEQLKECKNNKKKDFDSFEVPKPFNDDGYIFQYIDTNVKSNVSPLKLLLENEMNEKSPLGFGASNFEIPESENKESQYHYLEMSSAKKSLFASNHINDKVEDKSTVKSQVICSPQLFDSDDDQLNEQTSKVKTKPFTQIVHNSLGSVDKKSPGNLRCKSDIQEDVLQDVNLTASEHTEEKSGLWETRKRPLYNQSISDFVALSSVDADSDLEDFNLNKSFSWRDPRKCRGKQKSKPKGVHFTEFAE
ncbi:Fanconi anemia group J protein homolog isoform X4 [Cherax quadricarinatus]|uniref:Fanconi anemia group J protein homolog isoform X4 n=1 Tax=Cherax quadricarinatus TaxID=27406 RepID=UPI00387E4BCF